MIWPILTVALRNEPDIVLARQRARAIAEQLGFDKQDQTRIATAVSEIARNAYAYASHGRVEFAVESASGQALKIVIADEGGGITDLSEVLSGAYVSETGMGLGLVGARRLMDRFEIDNSESGLVVTLWKSLPGQGRMTGKKVGEIAGGLAAVQTGEPVAELGDANRALMESLEALAARQDELAELNVELENTNRGVVALYAELEQTADKLRAASEAKSRFLSQISHELRTPLNSIMALSHLLIDEVDGPLTKGQVRQVTYIRSAAEGLTDLVNNLLDIAKVEAGKIDVQIGPFEVAEVFASLRGLMRPLQDSTEVELIFDLPDALPTLHSDEAKVAQILRNLISNALKFTERGEVRVGVAALEDDQIVFTVRDTGIGLSPADQIRVFEEFEQVASPLQTRTKGTGLGLPLSRTLSSLLGGTLTLESAPGEGSIFTVRLPIDLRPSPTASRRVLVVDDEEAFRYALQQMAGPVHDVVEARDGVEALQAIRASKPAVMFLDLNMPNLDGYGVIRVIEEDSDLDDLKVVVSTSTMLEDRDRARLKRADFILGKDQLTRDTVVALIQGAPQ